MSLTPGRKWESFPRLPRLRQSTAPCLDVRLVLDQSETGSVVTWPGLHQSQLTSRCPPRICSACAGSRWSPCCCTAWGPSRGTSWRSPVTIHNINTIFSIFSSDNDLDTYGMGNLFYFTCSLSARRIWKLDLFIWFILQRGLIPSFPRPTLYPMLSRALSTSVAALKNSTRRLFSSLSSAVIADLSVTSLMGKLCF